MPLDVTPIAAFTERDAVGRHLSLDGNQTLPKRRDVDIPVRPGFAGNLFFKSVLEQFRIADFFDGLFILRIARIRFFHSRQGR